VDAVFVIVESIGVVFVVIPAKVGIQIPNFTWIPGRASYRQLARNDAGKNMTNISNNS
jgi:hypothetical protein